MDATGYILTNEHVVRGATWVTVILDSGARMNAYVAATDASRDIALIKVDTNFDSALRFATDARGGEEVIALGYPFGYRLGQSMTITAGIISAFRMHDGVAHIQTDSAINPGNSGGPLLNLSGEVVGMNTKRRQDAQGINFAIRYDVLAGRLPVLLADAAKPTTTTPTPAATPGPEPIFGPVDGEIEHEPDDGFIDSYYARGVSMENGIIEAHFHNPYSASVGQWSSGFLFRLQDTEGTRNDFHSVIIDQDGYFRHYLRSSRYGESDQRLAYRHIGEINIGASESNHIRIAAAGKEGKLYVNGHYIANLQLQGLMGAGRVYAVATYFTGHGVSGYSTRFEDFTIWPIGALR